jgi:putative solute:sodium symporter small subunit
MANEPDLQSPRVHAALERYWRGNLRLMAMLLCLWAAVSFGAGILFADVLNEYALPFTGFPLGFWFAQQGSIVVFVLCILIYCIAMNRLDRKHHEVLEEIAAEAAGKQGL